MHEGDTLPRGYPRRATRGATMSALAAMMLLLSSCVGERDMGPIASGAPPRSSPTMTSTPVTSPAGTPASPTPDPERCAQTVDDISMRVEAPDQTPPTLVREVKTAAIQAQDALADVAFPGCLSHQLIVHIIPGGGASNFVGRFRFISPRRGSIAIWQDDWTRQSSAFRLVFLLHEWWHQIQYLSAWCGAKSGCHRANVRSIPAWLFEADASLHGYRYADALGVASYEQEVVGYSGLAPGALTALREGTNLRRLSQDTTFWWYKMATYAGHDLVDGHPQRFVTFWRRVGQTGDWRLAFHDAFGITYDWYFTKTFVHRDRLWP